MNNIDIIKQLTGATEAQIKISDDGFLSYGYIIDGGRIVFKFKKHADVSYKNEIRILDYLNTLDLGINLQKAAWKSDDDSYLGIYGMSGQSLEHLQLSDAAKREIGKQLGEFLKKLHSALPESKTVYHIEDEISAWQKRFISAKEIFLEYFSSDELKRMNEFIMEEMPVTLLELGEKLVFSHADLGEGNVLIDEKGKIGVIDFNESGYADEAADFMDIEDDIICEEMLSCYGADEVLRKKVHIRRIVRPMFVVETYAKRGPDAVQKYIQSIRRWLDR